MRSPAIFRALSIAVALLAGCERSSDERPDPVIPAPIPCTSDAECRLEDASGCQCIVVSASGPRGPGCPHPCAVPPCGGNEAFCHRETSTCRMRPAP